MAIAFIMLMRRTRHCPDVIPCVNLTLALALLDVSIVASLL